MEAYHHKCLLEVFTARLVDDLIPSEILHHITVGLTKDDLEYIKLVDKHEGSRKATELLLRKIIESEEPLVAFAEFVKVLTHANGYRHLADLLSGDIVKDLEPQKRLLVALAPPLVEDMNAIHLCVEITCLSEEDRQHIRSDFQQAGPRAAAITLLNRLPKRGPTWFKEFLEALKKHSLHLYHQILGIKTDADGNVEDKEDENIAAKELHAGLEATNNRDVMTAENNTTEENKLSSVVVDENGDDSEQSCDSDGAKDLTKDEIETKTVLEVNLSKPDQESDDTIVNSACEENSQSSSIDEEQTNGEKSNDEGCEKPGTVGEEPDIQLRDYQAELATPCLNGSNVIICAPTGSGKTRIAAYVTYQHLKGRPKGEGKVLLLVNKVPLVEQHFNKEFSILTSKYKVSKICGETAVKVSFMELVKNNDIVILTAQILGNALRNGDGGEKLSLTDFSLLIFDECHHTQKGEVYNSIMSQYLTEKHEKQSGRLPQILGLTASLGVGGAKDKDKAVKHLLMLCANMDATVLKTVQEQKKELKKHNSKPKKCVEVVGDRDEDPCGDELKKIMKKIQEMLPTEFQNRTDFGTQVYEQFITEVNTKAVVRQDRKMQTCAEHLRKYNDALMVNDSARMIDAVNYLTEFYEMEERRSEGFDETDRELVAIFDKLFRTLSTIMTSKKKESENPKLQTLKDQILEEFKNKDHSRGIIFTKTRESTKALVAWIKDTPELNSILKVDRLTGSGSTSYSKNVIMTQKEQLEVIRKFQQGELNCIVATTVAEEGLDIPECNIVIRYNLVTNEIAMVQARGRARAEDSSYLLVAGHKSGAAERELTNMYKEKLEKDAVALVQKMSKEDFKKQVKEFQIQALNERKMQEASAKAKKQVTTADQADLICRKCSTVACNASEICKIENMHHVNPSESFTEMYDVREIKPVEHGYIINIGKIVCKKCKRDWGIMILYKGARLPCLSIKHFGLKFKNGVILTPKKWKDVPFEVEGLDFTEYLTQQLNLPTVSIKETE
ncbi:ATP-dependent RNA helicase DHX58-like [Ptychodera flava]|uniref:ATP-dependent RNA helicase DHX58-like n=1 Tax=Ptychodera flava TaxID=63121 RepID=UPI00396A00A3